MEKTFKTLDEQIKILQSKGLIIPDVEYAKEILVRENYFFLSGYRHLFLESSSNRLFIEGTTFNELYSLFYFDRHIRNIIFKNLLIIENNVKSIMAYELSQKYGIREDQYLNPKNFVRDPDRKKQVLDLLKKLKRQIRINGGQHQATQHYIDNYGYIPLWISVKVLSFGIVSELYSILKEEEQEEIANIYKIDIASLGIYLAILSNYRNLCAHEDILYDHRTQRAIPDTKYHYQLSIDKNDEDEYIYGKNDLFSVIIILRQMLSEEEFRNLVYEIGYEIDILDGKVNVLPLNQLLNKISFPNNWRDILEIH